MNIMKFFKNFLSGLYLSLKRFPLTLIFSCFTAVMLIVITKLQPINNTSLQNNLTRIAMTLALGIPLFLCIKLILEHRDKNKLYELIIYHFTGILFLFLYYLLLLNKLNMVSITRYTAVSLILYLGFLVIPYLPKKEHFEMYIIKVFTSFFITALYSLVLFLGLCAILFTINKLLLIYISSKTYTYTWYFVAFVFFPFYFLSEIPHKGQRVLPNDYPKLLRILLLYIVMPLLTVYTLILYIYFGKILITRKWPVGLVSNLVLWYSVITAAVIFFVTLLKNQNRWVSTFIKWLPKIILPILVMMFFSIGIRIKAYGVTENRYYVVALGLWVFGIMLYLSLFKKVLNIVLPVSLSIIAFISVFGPISSYSISKLSQNNRFEDVLLKNNMLANGEIIPAPPAISQEDRLELSGIINYFNAKHSLSDVKYLPKGFKTSDMNKIFGFQYENPNYNAPSGFFVFTSDQSNAPLDVAGYDYLFDTRSLYDKSYSGNKSINVAYDDQKGTFTVNYNGQKVYSKDLNGFIGSLIEKYGAKPNETMIPAEEMTFVDENNILKIKFVFMNISGNTGSSTPNIESKGLNLYVLVKIK